MKKLRAVLVGATGLAGQQFVSALQSHPFIELAGLAASPRNAGKRYADALRNAGGASGWFLSEPLPPAVADMTVVAGGAVDATQYDLAFSAVEADVARELEPRLAAHIPVISAASAFRYDDEIGRAHV